LYFYVDNRYTISGVLFQGVWVWNPKKPNFVAVNPNFFDFLPILPLFGSIYEYPPLQFGSLSYMFK